LISLKEYVTISLVLVLIPIFGGLLMFNVMSFWNKKIVGSVILALAFILPMSVLAMEATKQDPMITDFLNYIHGSKMSPKEMCHHIKSEDFRGEHYKFSYSDKEVYLRDTQNPSFPQYTPEGSPEKLTISAHAGGHDLKMQWLMLDNPTPGINTPEIITFHVTKIGK
jgi:hypothetical protein